MKCNLQENVALVITAATVVSGGRVAVGDDRGTVRLWDFDTILHHGHGEAVSSMVGAADGAATSALFE